MNVKNDILNLQLLDEERAKDAVGRLKISQEAIDLYNKALEKAKREDQDIAIIELKKALSLNENFIEALTLLGYCYYVVDNQTEAKKYLLKAAKLNEYGIRAYIALQAMGALDVPEDLMNTVKSDKKESGRNASVKKKSQTATSDDVPQASIHLAGYSGKSGRNFMVPVLLLIAAVLVVAYLLFLR